MCLAGTWKRQTKEINLRRLRPTKSYHCRARPRCRLTTIRSRQDHTIDRRDQGARAREAMTPPPSARQNAEAGSVHPNVVYPTRPVCRARHHSPHGPAVAKQCAQSSGGALSAALDIGPSILPTPTANPGEVDGQRLFVPEQPPPDIGGRRESQPPAHPFTLFPLWDTHPPDPAQSCATDLSAVLATGLSIVRRSGVTAASVWQ